MICMILLQSFHPKNWHVQPCWTYWHPCSMSNTYKYWNFIYIQVFTRWSSHLSYVNSNPIHILHLYELDTTYLYIHTQPFPYIYLLEVCSVRHPMPMSTDDTFVHVHIYKTSLLNIRKTFLHCYNMLISLVSMSKYVNGKNDNWTYKQH